MGTSMHMYVEKRQDDRWVYVPAPTAKHKGGSLPDDWYSDDGSCYDEMAVICGIRNYDGYVPAVPMRGKPFDPSRELEEALTYVDYDPVTWFMLPELENYDFDRTVMKMVRVYSPLELAQLGWLGNGDGTPYTDVQRHSEGAELEAQRARGYTEQPVPVRSEVERLFGLMERIRLAAGVPSDQIRVTCFFW